MTHNTEPNLDKELIQLLFGDEGIIETDGSGLMDRIRHAQLSRLERAKALLANQVREARLDGQLMALNSFYNSGEISSDSYKLSVKQIADRIAELNKEATQ